MQQSTYIAAVLIALHGLAYQLIDRRSVAVILLCGLVFVAVVALQLYGRQRVRAARRPG